MSITLAAVQFRHERRVRLVFTDTVGSGGFVATLYTVTSLDGDAASPVVQKALAVTSSPNVVELQLGSDLVGGALYRFSAPGVPAADSGSTPDPSDADARFGRERPVRPPIGTSPVQDLEELLYGRDLAWNGSDFAEATSGDLETASGLAVVETDLTARMLANGLPWDPAFGLKAREEVDGSPAALQGLRGRAVQQLLEDDRVASADAVVDVSVPLEPTLEMRPTLVGGALVRRGQALSLRTTLG